MVDQKFEFGRRRHDSEGRANDTTYGWVGTEYRVSRLIAIRVLRYDKGMQTLVFAVLGLLVPLTVAAEKSPVNLKSKATSKAPHLAEVDIDVRFDRTSYKLKLNGKEFVFQDGALRFNTKVAACNRAKFEPIARSYASFGDEMAKQPAREETDYDVQVTNRTKTTHIPRGGAYGTWLRDLPKRVPYLNAEAIIACRE